MVVGMEHPGLVEERRANGTQNGVIVKGVINSSVMLSVELLSSDSSEVVSWIVRSDDLRRGRLLRVSFCLSLQSLTSALDCLFAV